MQRPTMWALALALAAVAVVPEGHADQYPSKPIRLIIGFPPGSAADITARVVGDVMSQTLGQQIIVEARPGAGSSLAAEAVARSPADGYTLFIGTSSNVTNAAINSKLRFDFEKDFSPVTPLTGLPLILAVHPSLGVSSVKELIAMAKAKPGQLTYASVGHGTVPHLATELFALRTGIKLVHVPYQGSPPAVTDLLGGRVSLMLGVASTVAPHVKSGALKGLATASSKRPQIAPDLPTVAEAAALPDFESDVWFGMLAPAGTPRPVVDKLAAAANAALKQPGVASKLRASGFEPLGGPPDDFAKFISREMKKWGEAAKAAELRK
jgi:tripartite-type tricarboxylate transporter receptor subunit TctC